MTAAAPRRRTTDADIVIRRGVPIPAPFGRSVYPFADLAVGDAFDVPRRDRLPDGADRVQRNILAASYAWRKKYGSPARFTVRLLNETTVRCWRIA